MLVNVELWAFGNGEVRKVDLLRAAEDWTAEVLNSDTSTPAVINEVLERVFYWGQNENWPQELPSVSMGDVALLWGKKYLCCSVGWRELTEAEYKAYTELPQYKRATFGLLEQPMATVPVRKARA